MEHFYIKSGDPSCIGFEILCGKTNRHTNRSVLVSLHWLRVPEHIQYKIAVLTYKVLHGTAPRYLRPLDRVARSADTPLCQLQSPGGADVLTVYSRQSGIQRFWTSDLE